MRFDCLYDVVVELDYPLGESSELAFDTWGRDLQGKVLDRFEMVAAVNSIRAVRTNNHLKIALRVWSYALLGQVLSILLATVMPQAPEDIVLKVHQVEKEPAEVEAVPLGENA